MYFDMWLLNRRDYFESVRRGVLVDLEDHNEWLVNRGWTEFHGGIDMVVKDGGLLRVELLDAEGERFYIMHGADLYLSISPDGRDAASFIEAVYLLTPDTDEVMEYPRYP